MTYGERTSGPGLQVLLELYGARRIRKLDNDDDAPRTTRRGMSTASLVGGTEPPWDVRSQAGVEPGRVLFALQEVNETSIGAHALSRATGGPTAIPGKFL